jgi:ribosomal protein S1
VEVLSGALAVGAVLPEVLVLEARMREGFAVVTAKRALVAVAREGALPADVASVAPGAHVVGYVASVTESAAFVRMLGRLTAIAGRAECAEGFAGKLADAFKPGQTVRAVVQAVDVNRSRISVTLRPSAVATGGAELLAGFYECAAHRLATAVAAGAACCVPHLSLTASSPPKG